MFRLTRAQILPIGVDIGSDSVKMLQVEAVGTNLEVTAAAKMPLPAEAKSQPQAAGCIGVGFDPANASRASVQRTANCRCTSCARSCR